MGLMDRLKGMVGRHAATDAPAEPVAAEPVIEPPAAEEPAPVEPPSEPAPIPATSAPPSLLDLQRRLAHDSQNVDLAFEVAQAAYREGKTFEAIPVLHRVARMLIDQGDAQRAIDAYLTIKNLGCADTETHFQLATLFRAQGRLAEAEVEVRGVLRQDLNNLEALTLLTDLTVERGNFRDALLTCNKMLSVDPRDPVAREKLGDVQAAAGSPEEAVKAYLLAALGYVGMQEKAEGLRLYQRVLELDPNNATALRETANLR